MNQAFTVESGSDDNWQVYSGLTD